MKGVKEELPGSDLIDDFVADNTPPPVMRKKKFICLNKTELGIIPII